MLLLLHAQSLPPPLPTASHSPSRLHHSSFSTPTTTIRRKRTSTTIALAVSTSDATDDFTAYSGYLFNQTDSEITDSPISYDISKIYAVYQRKPLILFRRLYQTATTLGKWFALTYFDSITSRSDSMFKVRAAELRKILVKLGPAYIKIAQAISSRPDLIPPSYLDELSLLQDQIAPFPTAVAYRRIEQDLKAPLEDVFSEISPLPVAAASLGQVYKARLRDSGKLVAVKVQRPGVQAAISLDILILRFLTGLIKKAGKLNTDLQAVVDEWATSLFRVNQINAGDGLQDRSKQWT